MCRHLLFALALTAVVAVPGCQRYKPIPCDPTAYVGIPETGTATIEGQAFTKTRGGDVKYAIAEMVWLAPCTEYDHGQLLETLDALRWGADPEIKGKIKPKAPDPAAAPYRKTTKTDAEGHFTFTEVPAGQWLLAVRISWEVPSALGQKSTGSSIIDTIRVEDGKTISVMLTP